MAWWVLTNLPIGGLSRLSCSLVLKFSRYVFFAGLTDLPARSFEEKDRLNMAVSGNPNEELELS